MDKLVRAEVEEVLQDLKKMSKKAKAEFSIYYHFNFALMKGLKSKIRKDRSGNYKFKRARKSNLKHLTDENSRLSSRIVLHTRMPSPPKERGFKIRLEKAYQAKK